MGGSQQTLVYSKSEHASGKDQGFDEENGVFEVKL